MITSQELATLLEAIIRHDAEQLRQRLPKIDVELARDIEGHAALLRNAHRALAALSGLMRRLGAR